MAGMRILLFVSAARYCFHIVMRAKRGNPGCLRGKILDCFAPLAMTRGLSSAHLARQHPLLDRLDLEREESRIDPALCEAAGNEPQPGLFRARIHVAQLKAVAKAPDRADAVGNIVAEQ